VVFSRGHCVWNDFTEVIDMSELEKETIELRVQLEKAKAALVWCDEMLTARDEMNSKVHCAPVRLSPITELVKITLRDLTQKGPSDE
jgi:hypothetical protein